MKLQCESSHSVRFIVTLIRIRSPACNCGGGRAGWWHPSSLSFRQRKQLRPTTLVGDASDGLRTCQLALQIRRQDEARRKVANLSMLRQSQYSAGSMSMNDREMICAPILAIWRVRHACPKTRLIYIERHLTTCREHVHAILSCRARRRG
jgi:hypothetical protein